MNNMNPKQMRQETLGKAAIWMKFENEYSNKFSNYLHCFFEGEDHKYYSNRIERHTNYEAKEIINYNCSGRETVIEVYKKILSSKKYKDITTLFFIDKDYGLDSYKGENKIYETPYYSIENFYTTEECFAKIINTEFSINYIENDFQKVIEDYKTVHSNFQKIMIPLNVWNLYHTNKKNKVYFDKFNLDDFFEKISVEEITIINPISIESINNYYINKLGKRIEDKEKLDEFKSYDVINEKEYKILLNKIINTQYIENRGKYEFYFLKKIIFDLKNKNKDKKYFSTKRTSIKIDETSSNILASLSAYAATSECLINFLEKHKKAS